MSQVVHSPSTLTVASRRNLLQHSCLVSNVLGTGSAHNTLSPVQQSLNGTKKALRDKGRGPPWPQPAFASLLCCREYQEVNARTDLVRLSLQAQQKLQEELDVHNEEEVPYALATGRQKLRQFADAYHKLINTGAITECEKPSTMHGYYTLLEQQIQDKDKDFLQFEQVLSGEAGGVAVVGGQSNGYLGWLGV